MEPFNDVEEEIIIKFSDDLITALKQEYLIREFKCSKKMSQTLLYLGNSIGWHACNFKQIVKYLELNEEEAQQFKQEFLSFTKDTLDQDAFIEVKEGFFQKPTGPNEGYSYDGYKITPEFLEVKPQVSLNSPAYIMRYLKELYGDKAPILTFVPIHKIKKIKKYAFDSKDYLSPKNDILGEDSRQSKMTMGKMGEAVFEQTLRLHKIPYHADDTHHTKADNYDFLICNSTIDVKTINGGTEGILRVKADKFKKYHMAIYVVVRLYSSLNAGYNVGWCTREDIIKNHSKLIKSDYGHWNYEVKQKDLRPMSELVDYLFK